MQDWLLENDPVYRENYHAALKHPDGLDAMQHVLRWQFNAARRRMARVGLLDEHGRPTK
jgi:hypothetical protein